jgi:hypothetical protein
MSGNDINFYVGLLLPANCYFVGGQRQLLLN